MEVVIFSYIFRGSADPINNEKTEKSLAVVRDTKACVFISISESSRVCVFCVEFVILQRQVVSEPAVFDPPLHFRAVCDPPRNHDGITKRRQEQEKGGCREGEASDEPDEATGASVPGRRR